MGTGRLFVVATPIGNLDDLSPRAADVLRRAAAIFCEDTRVTAKLAARFGLSAPRISCHAHNEEKRIADVVGRLRAGEDVALVSDAGTPAFSDPGERLVAAAAAAGFPVVAVPGPSAAAAALSVSGLPAVPHLFLGFPPAKAGARRAFFAACRDRAETLVWFEAPHRLASSLADAAAVLGDRPAVVARELTKLHEETLRGGLAALRDAVAGRETVRGECVVVARGASAPEGSASADAVDARIASPDVEARIASPDVDAWIASPNADARIASADVDARIERLEGRGLSAREIARRVAGETGIPSRDVYRRIVERRR